MDVFLSASDLQALHRATYHAKDINGNYVLVSKTDERAHDVHALLGGDPHVVPLVGMRIGDTTFWWNDEIVKNFVRRRAS